MPKTKFFKNKIRLAILLLPVVFLAVHLAYAAFTYNVKRELGSGSVISTTGTIYGDEIVLPEQTAPGAPSAGWIYMDSTAYGPDSGKKMYYYDGNSWIPF